MASSVICTRPAPVSTQATCRRNTDVTPLREERRVPGGRRGRRTVGRSSTWSASAGTTREDFGLETRVVRFHNIFGPLGTYDGGREKSPAAICRKVALAEDGDRIEVWGDGEQTRSYCLHRRLRRRYSSSDAERLREPLNLGQDRMLSINELVDIVAGIAGKTIGKRYDLTKPQGVRGRNSDNCLLREALKWEPQISLEEGLARTYSWIREQLIANGQLPAASAGSRTYRGSAEVVN